MSALDNDGRSPEIIIVRRNGDDEDDDHHSSAWKIAFADFMTAMMCFFLVMWLINAANEQTRAALASYFNPVKLIDRNTSRKGLEDIGQGPQSNPKDAPEEGAAGAPGGRQDQSSGPMHFEDAKDLSETRKLSDENLFSDPYAVLAEIAADTGTRQNVSPRGEGGEQTSGPASGASGGESYRDPFAPDFWSQQVAAPEAGVQGDPDRARALPTGAEQRAETRGAHPSAGSPKTAPEDISEDGDATRAPRPEAVAALEPLAPPEEPVEPAEETEAATETEKREAIARDLRAELESRFAGSPLEGSVTVVAREDGIVVSITDDMEHGMFAVGSAVPERELVLAMDKIGAILSERRGTIKIHGHTDGRPFRSETYDNWRLSTARAHAAYYMLARGGVDEARVREVAGFADRDLRIADDPYAAANRRIEILLELVE